MDDGNTIRQRFGSRVKDARKAKRLSQEGFADLCGLDRTYVGGVERGERNISLENIQKIADALGLPIAELFRFPDAE
ncbi:helix-turn-helix domain-containing protein [Paeniroseomonas aquatica]|uniref:Helix-turn-helix transcriptional regulator n=1 Tax=Paeniroseomonas aquatica TaxID=373043 RepID=A0ABT8AG95_9PROT|nr:helix-turn-helix transcriptional regulator [Paeniroseomonas aquatica]MDN3568713.1 helix-turn-helix transcriptional regulator [Paeniroseomonas aquatica]